MPAAPFDLAWFLQGSSIQAWGESWTGNISEDARRLGGVADGRSHLCPIWAMQYVPSGLAATIDFALIPVALLGFAMLLREEAFDRGRVVVIGLGVVGVICLFWTSVAGPGEGGGTQTLLGAAAIVFSVVTYCGGSVLARPLLRAYPAALIAGTTNLIGGALLVCGALTFEVGDLALLAGSWSVAVRVAISPAAVRSGSPIQP